MLIANSLTLKDSVALKSIVSLFDGANSPK